MQQELRFATFNVCNLAPPGQRVYDNLEPSTADEYSAKIAWTAAQIDELDADVIGFQEIFSQAALLEALSRTERYRDAFHVGFDPDPALEKLTPSVALVSRLPLLGSGVQYARFPAGISLPIGHRDPDRFARPVVHAVIQAAPTVAIDVMVVHLKSRRPEFRSDDTGEDEQAYAMATLRSLIRRGTEAVALRVMLSQLAREHRRARVVLGDFNDVADAVTTSIVMGSGAPLGDRLHDAFQIQVADRRGASADFSLVHEGRNSTIDHILVSEEFNPASVNAIGEVAAVRYFNEHLIQGVPQSSDHGQVLARLRLF
jgi:endonuclease/exonuclease/phosphatase family metal-dependent hydrolase